MSLPGLPLPVGEPAINPKPREMICSKFAGLQAFMVALVGRGRNCYTWWAVIAEKTWNARLGITGGLSVLGTTGVVRPFLVLLGSTLFTAG